MSKIITIDPLTRISGFLEIQAEVDNNTIINAKSSGLLFRGFEKMLISRSPLDAVYFTERICGICSTAHAYASSRGLENALNIVVSQNDNYIRDIIHGFEFIQNHLRHFYLLTLPDFVKITDLKVAEQQWKDFRLPERLNSKLQQHYFESFQYARLAHEGLAVLGGKAPHTHGIFCGGITVMIDKYKLEKVKSLIRTIKEFVSTAMVEDLETLVWYYSDYFNKGISYNNFLSYGIFNQYDDKDITYVKAGVMKDGAAFPFNPENITEQIKYSWYINDQTPQEIDLSKSDAYSFIKTPQYEGLPMEVGPLARLIINGEYTHGHSCLDRIIARVLETEKILNIMGNLAQRVEMIQNEQKQFQIPDNAMGAGLIDTSRGALGHWVQIENKTIKHYNLITPSVWNISPRDDQGVPGVVEKSLIGTQIQNVDDPAEIGRIVRSYDPCVSCATHIFGSGISEKIIEVKV